MARWDRGMCIPARAAWAALLVCSCGGGLDAEGGQPPAPMKEAPGDSQQMSVAAMDHVGSGGGQQSMAAEPTSNMPAPVQPMGMDPTTAADGNTEIAPDAEMNPGCKQAFEPLPMIDCGPSGVAMEAHGPADNRVNYVILGDAYTADLLDTQYLNDIQNMLTEQETSMYTTLGQPYLRYRKFINVCALKVESTDACVDNDDVGRQCDTALGGRCVPPCGPTRLGVVDDGLVDDAIAERLPDNVDVDWVAVTINGDADGWWNSGGRIMVWNGNYENRARSASVALHEGGHSFHGLADEYGGSDCGRRATQANVTDDPNAAKWDIWLGFDQSVRNPQGTGAELRDNEDGWIQGTFEGALYCDSGYYRPTDDSEMNILPASFNMPSVDKIIRDIYDIVDPIDDHTENDQALTNPEELRVRVVDPEVLSIDWLVDDEPVSVAAGPCFDATTLSPGAHSVTARVYDDTPWVRSDRAKLEQSVSWTVVIE